MRGDAHLSVGNRNYTVVVEGLFPNYTVRVFDTPSEEEIPQFQETCYGPWADAVILALGEIVRHEADEAYEHGDIE